jgi:hypothetical protein
MNGWATCTRCGTRLPTKPEHTKTIRHKSDGRRQTRTWGTYSCRCGRVSRRLVARREA